MLHTKYQGSKPYGQTIIFFMFFPLGEQFLAPGILYKLGRGLLGDAMYQKSRLEALGFQTRIFFSCFSLNNCLCKTCDPWAGPLAPEGII